MTSLSESNKEYLEYALSREDEAGMIFACCDQIPQMFIAVKSENDLRDAIDTCLKNAHRDYEGSVSVYTNGSISGPLIRTIVRVEK